jgi:MFS family permease
LFSIILNNLRLRITEIVPVCRFNERLFVVIMGAKTEREGRNLVRNVLVHNGSGELEMSLNQTLRSTLNAFSETFSPLAIRNLRIYLGGQAISLLGTWMQVTAQSWVVWKLSHSTATLGLVAMLSLLPFLIFSPWAGVWADRLDRRRFLIGSQVAAMVLAIILAVLVTTNVVQIWHVCVLAFLLGIVNTFDFTVQQAFVVDLTDKEQLRRAIVINFAFFQLGRTAGPALAGWVISIFGVSLAFWLNALSFVAVIVTLFLVRSNQVRRESTGKPLSEFREGVRFIASQPRLLDLVFILFMITFFMIAAFQLLPAFATDVLHGEADTLGLLQGASGAGAFVGALFLAPIALRFERAGLVVAIAGTIVGTGYTLLSLSSVLPVSMLSLFCSGIAGNLMLTMVMGIVQFQAPPAMRGRVNSVMMMVAFGSQPISALVLGAVATVIGTPGAIFASGILMLTGAGAFLVFRPELRRWRISSGSPAVQRPEATPESIPDIVMQEVEQMAA